MKIRKDTRQKGGRRRFQAKRAAEAGAGPQLGHAGARAEDGNMLVLGVGAWMVVAALLFVLSSASALYAERRDLMAEADSMALALADEIDTAAYYSGAEFPGVDAHALAARSAALARPGTSVSL